MQFEQSCLIAASLVSVDRCLTEEALMRQWLNPILRCEAVGIWATSVGSRFRFIIEIPLLQPTLDCLVIERELGNVVWEFTGFFEGTDRWQAHAQDTQTRLVNQFIFTIPNPIIASGFSLFATLTQRDMQAQLQRFKRVAESLD